MSGRIVFGLILMMGFLACSEQDADKANAVAKPMAYPVETGVDVEIVYTDSGFTKANVKAPLLERYASDGKNYTEMKEGINVVFLTKAQTVESFLTANYAISYDVDKKMIARNNVVVRNIDGDTLKTEELVWDQITQKVSSDKYVTIATKDELIMGDGFESDVSFKNPRIYKIRGVVSLK
jgi:LPS export ABC transporter protein LptC